NVVRAPDLAVILNKNLPPAIGRAGFVQGAPDIAIEIVSASNSFDEIQDRIHDYLTAGAQSVWVIHPGKQTVTIYHGVTDVIIFADPNAVVIDAVLAGLQIPLIKLFDFTASR